MTRVTYDGKLIQPAPFVAVQKQYLFTPDGHKIGSVFNITVNGTIVSHKGSPKTDGSFWTLSGNPPDEVITNDGRLASIIRKVEAIRDLFSVDGRSMEWQSADGSAPMKCNPRVKELNFEEGPWYHTCKYQITLEADLIYVNGTDIGEDDFTEFLSEATESWTIETNEEPENISIPQTYRLTHTVSATGKLFYDETGNIQREPWQQAREWVLPRLGIDSAFVNSTGVHNLPSYYNGYNHVRSVTTDELAGQYSVTETWLLMSGNYIENFTVDTTLNGALKQIGIQGSIQGVETRDSNFNLTQTKWEAASGAFNSIQNLLHSRAQSYAGVNLNSEPLNYTIGRSPANGNITYNYTYDNRPSNLITGTRTESIRLSNSWGVDIFSSLGVIGRGLGPVLQSVGTREATTRTLNIELLFEELPSGTTQQTFFDFAPRHREPTKTEIQNLVNKAHPVLSSFPNNLGEPATVAYVSAQTEDWEPIQSRYVYSVTWTYE